MFHIYGAGPCGLYAAHTALSLGEDVHLHEKEAVPGGLAAGHERGDNWYDLGVHMLHAFNPEVFQHCREAMGQERIEVPLKAHIQWNGKTYHYPLRGRDILAGIPPLTLARCLTGLLVAELQARFGSGEQGSDAESALIELYGSPLYQFFFEDFTHRYWGIHPRDLSAEFVRRKMPRLSAVDVFKNLLEKLKLTKPRDSTEGALRFETLHYSRTGSETLPRRLAADLEDRGAHISYQSPLGQLSHNQTHILPAEDQHLSTIPLPDLIQALDPPAPAEVRQAAAKLRFKPMVVYALLVKKDQCLDSLYTYYRDRIFHRVGEPKNAGLLVKPSGHTTLIVEMTCEKDDEKWTGKAWPKIVSDLASEGICQASDIVEKHLLTHLHAYPIFSKGFESHLATVQDYLETFQNLQSTGRQGAFTYPNMHTAMQMGATAATTLHQRKQTSPAPQQSSISPELQA